MKTPLCRVLLSILMLLVTGIGCLSAKTGLDTILVRVFSYPQTIDIKHIADTTSYAYMKSSLHINKRNIFLMAVPTMYVVAHGGSREYVSESYNKVVFQPSGDYKTEKLLSLSTVPRRHVTMPTMIDYLTPNIYDVTMVSENILSPFNKQNKKYYKYSIEETQDSLVTLSFKPKLKNTLLVDGSAIVNPADGKIIQIRLTGEYDMVQFRLFIKMGSGGMQSLLPEKCNLDSRFMFLGNDIRARYDMAYNLPKVFEDTITDDHDLAKMEMVRPQPLTSHENAIYERVINARKAAEKDTTKIDTIPANTRRLKLKAILWDMIGENVLTHIKQNFGPDRQGYFRINPVLNPLFMGYNHNQGYYYKFNIRGGYKFTENSDIWLQFKAGYSFKLKQFYFFTPLIYYYDKQHNGYLKSALSSGRRVKNRRIINELKIATADNPIWEQLHLDEFKDTYWDFYANYDISKYVGLQAGFVLHHRTALDKTGFDLIKKPKVYSSIAPKVKVQYRPWGYSGPILMASCEKSIKNLAGANVPYTRWEFDGQYILPLHNVQSLSMRIGCGFYTHRGANDYFVDFENFRETFLPDGWIDKWSGEFELLNADIYNESNYYARGNFTYESPFLLLAWTPFLGHFIERERFYLSILSAKNAHPYTEFGYVVKTRLLSIGAFVSSMNGRYKDFGFKFGFELFRQW